MLANPGPLMEIAQPSVPLRRANAPAMIAPEPSCAVA